MNTQQLQTLLGSLSGHLAAGSPQQEREIEQLNQLLSRSLLLEDLRQQKGSSFAFENADLFAPEKIPAARLDALRAIAEARAGGDDQQPEFRVFVREVPVRSTQLHASVPLWAGGAVVDRTIGPLTASDGRRFWFDFFRIEKLVALYVQGQPHPALLFKVTVGLRFIGINLPLAADEATSYRLPAGSIWINSAILAPGAPAGHYTGLTIEGGTISLGAPPQTVNGKLTINPATVVNVKLQLRQPAVINADASSPYGIDARAAELQLPRRLSFHFSGTESRLDEIGSSRWNTYGHEASFEWNRTGTALYDSTLHRVLIPLASLTANFEVADCRSPFHTLRGRAPIKNSAWALPSAPIDILHPSPAAGIGALLVKCRKGLSSAWKGLKGGELNLGEPSVLAEPGRIGITDLAAGNVFCQQTFALWKDEQNPYGATIALQYTRAAPLFYNTFADGNEALMIAADADVQTDRPVTVAGEALAIRSKNSLLVLAVNKTLRLIYLFDDNILFDNIDFTQKSPSFPRPVALALRNALFKVTPVNGCLLFGQLAEDFVEVSRGFLFLTFGMYAYLPTLPDPYAANLGNLRAQFRTQRGTLAASALRAGQNIWLLLVCQVKWESAADADAPDEAEVSFHFAPLPDQSQSSSTTGAGASSAIAHSLFSAPAPPPAPADIARSNEFAIVATHTDVRMPDYARLWDEQTGRLRQDAFALLDVSTKADLLGVSFALFGDRRMAMVTTHTASAPGAAASVPGFPLQVQGMDVVSQGINVRAFTPPLISWEPVVNLTPKAVKGDPEAGVNYYPDDGGPTRLINNSPQQVALAPIPLTNFLVEAFDEDDKFTALALFTLPFGLKALAVLQQEYVGRAGTRVAFNSKSFADGLSGARQLEIHGGEAQVEGQNPMFKGSTVQLNNILDLDGAPTGNSTLGKNPTIIFNNEFFPESNLINERGVPLTRLDISGYGASIFSHWLNPQAPIASTSQAKFDVFVGRCAHEIIQVKSLMYPWAIKVVRTITLWRTGSGYVYRHDSGWKAESDGCFDFSYYVYVPNTSPPPPLKTEERQATYQIHPGIVKCLFNVRDIQETEEILPFKGQMTIKAGADYVNNKGVWTKNAGGDLGINFLLQPVYFSADVEIENPVSGHVTKTINGEPKQVVPSRRILGFVQIEPLGQPLTNEALRDLIKRQQGSIGGPADCVINIGRSGQLMRLNRFDVSNSFAANGVDPIFVAAGRGNVILPKDGSWSMVRHQHGTGEVSPVAQDLSVSLIRTGRLVKPLGGQLALDLDPDGQLLRVADTTELLRPPVADTVNYGFLQTTDTQKALFLTPSFRKGSNMLLSKTPPLFADAFRIVNSKAIFPNIGDAAGNFGDAISLVKSGAEFTKSALTDGGKQVWELMQIDKVAGGVREEGYKLLKKVEEFALPSVSKTLIEIGSFKIYLEYKADKIEKPGGGTKNLPGSLNFDVDSFAANVADKWKSRMSNVGLVVDLGPIKRLMTIKGNWDARKGAEAQYKGSDTDPDFPSPQIEFSPELQPVIDILQILQDLRGENYKDAFQRGVRLAMSNKAGSWEYKFEASKEIPVVRFPMPDFLYNDPNAPLKLEAGLKLGAYFNAALKVPTNANQLLPTAGGYLGFYGRLSVMCVSLSIATVYAIGQVNLDIGADTKLGPTLRMKFGFGAQLVVGLPVVGNVSVLYMVGVEIYLDSSKVSVSAFLLFQGHAELLAGLISVTITIEAKGTVSRSAERTDLSAQVTFALEISLFLIIDISFSTSWEEQRQIA